MKLPFTIHDLRFTIWKKSGGAVSPLTAGGAHGVTRPAALNRQSQIVNRKSKSGIALVLTLILLSVTLVMALAFLAISGRERGSVTTQTDTATTRLAAEAGLAAAEAQITANILSTTNPYSFGLIVSTNYLPPTNGNPLLDLTNLWFSPRVPVLLTNLVTHAVENRFYLDLNRNGVDDPNGLVPEVNSAGFLTGNTNFEVGDPEWIGVLERPDQPYGPNNKFIARFAFIALPAGNALDLNAIHNQAHMPLTPPTLPLNWVVNPPVNQVNNLDSFVRNEGIGSWEINLAAFLADLNTNQWDSTSPYLYPYPQAFTSPAIDDARALLAYRYNNDFSSLTAVNNLFSPAGVAAFTSDNIDGYTYGQPLMTGFQLPGEQDFNLKNIPWAGADNTNHFFTPEELFDKNVTTLGVPPGKTAVGNDFADRLLAAGTNYVGGNIPTYDRYTFYRMLSQLGTDTAPESGKMNLNYDNLDPGANGVVSATNFMAWQPITFFTNAADRLLKAYTAQWFQTGPSNYLATYYGINGYSYYHQDSFGNTVTNDPSGLGLTNVPFYGMTNQIPAFGVTGIPVLAVGNKFVYTPAVNRLLQLAANMYDATTTNHYPDIFRPIFTVVPENGYNDVYVTGYTTNIQTGSTTYANQNPFIDHINQMGEIAPPVDVTALSPSILLSAAVTYTNVNVYGVPWIVGAKKGFPNFNAFSIESAFQLVRKLEVVRNTNAAPTGDVVILTNQMYLMNITNFMALSCWNSYRSNYPGPVDIVVRCNSTIMLTNDNNLNPPYAFYTNFAFATEIAPNWPQWNGVAKQASGSFIVPLSASVQTLTNAIYYYNEPSPPNPGLLLAAGDSPSNYLDKGIRELPHFWLLMTNRLQVAIIDYSTNVSALNVSGPVIGRIVDYVQLGGMDSSQLLNTNLPENAADSFWNTNYEAQGNLEGVLNQIQVSELGTTLDGQTPTGPAVWNDALIPGGPVGVTSKEAQQAFFRGFFAKDGSYNYGGQFYVNTQTSMQAPYTPMAFAIQHTTWGANDPLVHYLSSDLAAHTENPAIVDWNPDNLLVSNDRYQPWGLTPPSYDGGNGIDQNAYNLSFKDPLVRGSDDWDFPTNKFPTVGWLGRVHRGTPWQTVYLKSTNILDWANNSAGQTGINTWINWTGDFNLSDATNAAPVQDRLLFDLFTTAFNDNATRGQLSVNISSNSLAAWSAVFSGVTVLNNNFPNALIGKATRYQKPLPGYLPPSYTNLVINPAGTYNSTLPLAQQPALAQIVAGIDQTRATFTNADGLVGAFEHEGDILAVPQLADQSPFLNWNNAAQQANGISDEMYEWLPQQVMSLVRVSSSPRYVIYTYGQALKPAPNGVYLGTTPAGTFGMITNYQVVAEMAARAVVRLETVRTNLNGVITVTPPRAVVESFNILPPN
jgi:hypothetical protein